MKKINYFVVLLSAILLTSCAVNRTPFQNYPSITEVKLDHANFRIVGDARGYSRQVYVLGIGGFSEKSLRENAISDMYANAHLTGSQTIVNITTAVSVSGFLIFYFSKRASAYGTIIEFLDHDGNPIQSEATQDTAPRAAAPTSDNDSKVIDANTSYQGSAPRSSQADTKQTSEANEGTFVPVVINHQWGASTKSIAKTYNDSHQVDAIYDFNEDGKLSEEELEYINYILCDSKKAPNKQKFFEMAHKDYVNTVGRIKKK